MLYHPVQLVYQLESSQWEEKDLEDALKSWVPANSVCFREVDLDAFILQ